MGGARVDTKQDLLVRVNASIRTLATDPAVAWAFRCECGAEDCHTHVMLTVHEYGGIHDDGGTVLAVGHEAGPRSEASRLRREAHALRAQAELQFARARRYLGGK